MIFLLFGTPSTMSQWALHLTTQMLRVARGDVMILPCVFISQMREAWSKREGRPVLVFSDSPEAELADLLLRSGAPAVLVHDNPLRALRTTMVARKLDLRQSLRFLSQSYSTLHEQFQASATHIVSPRHEPMQLRNFIAELAEAFKLTLSDTEIGSVVAKMVGVGQEDSLETVGENIRRHLPLVAAAPDLNDDDKLLAQRLLKHYVVAGSQRPLMQVECPIDLLYHWDKTGSFLSVDTPIELLGPMRLLTAGHVLHLPKGSWRATLELEVAENLSGNGLSADILGGDESLAGVSAPLPAAGMFSFYIDFEVRDAFVPLQLRIVLQQGAIEGRMTLHKLLFTRQANGSA